MCTRLEGRLAALPPDEKAPEEPSVAKTSNIPVYFLKKFTLARAYRSMGGPWLSELSPSVSDEMKARAPWYNEMWFRWEETPQESKVIRTSFAQEGGYLLGGPGGRHRVGKVSAVIRRKMY